MLKMFHYAKKGNTIMKDGLFGIKKSNRSLRPYAHRAGTDNPEKIYKWLDSTFEGRSNSISCLTEKIVWKGNDKVLKSIVDGCDLFSFDLERLVKDGVVTAIWCKQGSDAGGYNEKFEKVALDDIDYSPAVLRPTIADAIIQCPKDILDQVVAFEFVAPSRDTKDYYDKVLGMHVLTTVYYAGVVPQEIAAQKVSLY